MSTREVTRENIPFQHLYHHPDMPDDGWGHIFKFALVFQPQSMAHFPLVSKQWCRVLGNIMVWRGIFAAAGLSFPSNAANAVRNAQRALLNATTSKLLDTISNCPAIYTGQLNFDLGFLRCQATTIVEDSHIVMHHSRGLCLADLKKLKSTMITPSSRVLSTYVAQGLVYYTVEEGQTLVYSLKDQTYGLFCDHGHSLRHHACKLLGDCKHLVTIDSKLIKVFNRETGALKFARAVEPGMIHFQVDGGNLYWVCMNFNHSASLFACDLGTNLLSRYKLVGKNLISNLHVCGNQCTFIQIPNQFPYGYPPFMIDSDDESSLDEEHEGGALVTVDLETTERQTHLMPHFQKSRLLTFKDLAIIVRTYLDTTTLLHWITVDMMNLKVGGESVHSFKIASTHNSLDHLGLNVYGDALLITTGFNKVAKFLFSEPEKSDCENFEMVRIALASESINREDEPLRKRRRLA